MLLDARDIECSTGSACSAGVARPSHVLLALGHDEERARGSLRFSLGHTSTPRTWPRWPGHRPRGRAGTFRGGGGRDRPMRVLAALSGGVDSAVAAARAVDAGHDVTAVHLALSQFSAHGDRARADAARWRTRVTPAGPPTFSASRSTSGTSPSSSAAVSSTTSSPSTPPAGLPTRASAATSGSSSPPFSTGRSRSASTLSAPATTRGWSTAPCTVPPTSKDQSYVLAVLQPRPARPRDVPARRQAQGRGPSRGAAPRARCRRQAGQPRHLLHPEPTCVASWAGGWASGRVRSSTRTGARWWARTTAPTPSPSASAGGCASADQRPTDGRATCCR